MHEIPEAVPPMLAVEGELPTGPWAYEYKWDGYRCCLRAAPDGTTRLTSRNGNELTAAYPELTGLPPAAFGGLATVLDGEVVALDPAGRPDFGLLQRRGRQRPAGGRAAPGVTYFAFDLLRSGGTDYLRAPYTERRSALLRLAAAAEPAAEGRIAVPPHYTADAIAPLDLLGIARRHGLEGLMAKRLDSPYLPGRRSRSWVKRPLVRTQEVVIGGWQPGAGRRSGTIGSLLLGAHDAAGDLRYIGHVGSGFTEAALADLLRRLTPLARGTSPFAGPVPPVHARTARWCRPRLVGEVAFRAWTRDGRLRQPSWRGLRQDTSPAQAVLPPPPG
ncbi:non-homologous end-joining DNA ligase [Streptomyces marincola]|uniref:non-homologous end-joining DNA ligase n=1 Tax=Streptomyces marincola TaxID=2878388 RepID=UPI001CF0ECAA|nr:non-homologous end-joining DNA ligase [Streptomyces marincola]UCM91242.1 non-homologous end-joining DNA ligase [Streptomyces marincola]